MAKTEQELKELRQEIEQMREKLAGLTAGELETVTGGTRRSDIPYITTNPVYGPEDPGIPV